MFGVKKSAVFLLIVTLTEIIYSVNGRSVDPDLSIVVEKELVIPSELITEKVVPPVVESVTEVRIENVPSTVVPFVEGDEAIIIPVQSDREKVRVLYIMLDAIKAVNEKTLELVDTYLGKLGDKNPPSIVEVIQGAGVVADEMEITESPVQTDEIIAKELTPESSTDGKTLKKKKKPQQRPPVSPSTQVHILLGPIQNAIKKYKAALNTLVKKVQTIPNHIIKKFKGSGLLFDEVEGDAVQQADPVIAPEEESDAEKPADDATAEKPADEAAAEKPADAPETDATRSNNVGRKLDISNLETLSESETVLNSPEEIAANIKVILEATRKMNEHSLNLVEVYLSRLIDLTVRDRIDLKSEVDDIVLDARASASEIQEITVPIDAECPVGYIRIEGECQQVFTPPIVPTNPLIQPLNSLINFIGTILEPVVPKKVAEDIATQLKIRAEAIVNQFSN